MRIYEELFIVILLKANYVPDTVLTKHLTYFLTVFKHIDERYGHYIITCESIPFWMCWQILPYTKISTVLYQCNNL